MLCHSFTIANALPTIVGKQTITEETNMKKKRYARTKRNINWRDDVDNNRRTLKRALKVGRYCERRSVTRLAFAFILVLI